MFRLVQERQSLKSIQLLLDMKVRWGSTYVMLHRAEFRKTVRIMPHLVLLYLSNSMN